MADRTRVAAVDDVPEHGSHLFTVRELDGREEEVILVACDDAEGDVEAWKNFCQHEPGQRLDRGFGAAVRDGGVVCPKHGSTFDSCSGHCDNGKAAGTTLVGVEVAVDDGDVYLTDSALEYLHDGGVDAGGGGGDDEDEGMPGSTSHLTF